jgi:hypothetical protein
VTIDELHSLVKSFAGPAAVRRESKIFLCSPTRFYRDGDGDNVLTLKLEIFESPDGLTRLRILVFPFLEISEPKHREQLLVACMFLQTYPQSIVQYHLMENFLGLGVELPLLDNRITAGQLQYCLNDLNTVAETRFEVLCSIMKTGKFDALKATMNHLPDITGQWLTSCEAGGTDWI